MSKLCPKVLLEGTRLTHKTEIALTLNEHPGFVGPRRYHYPSPLVSARINSRGSAVSRSSNANKRP